jgi:hypothetical protein
MRLVGGPTLLDKTMAGSALATLDSSHTIISQLMGRSREEWERRTQARQTAIGPPMGSEIRGPVSQNLTL